MSGIYPALYLAACLFLAAAAGYMIFARCYDDGLVGKLSLFPVLFGAGAAISNAIADWRLPHDPRQLVEQAWWIILGLSLFTARHLWRFWGHRRREMRGARK